MLLRFLTSFAVLLLTTSATTGCRQRVPVEESAVSEVTVPAHNCPAGTTPHFFKSIPYIQKIQDKESGKLSVLIGSDGGRTSHIQIYADVPNQKEQDRVFKWLDSIRDSEVVICAHVDKIYNGAGAVQVLSSTIVDMKQWETNKLAPALQERQCGFASSNYKFDLGDTEFATKNGFSYVENQTKEKDAPFELLIGSLPGRAEWVQLHVKFNVSERQLEYLGDRFEFDITQLKELRGPQRLCVNATSVNYRQGNVQVRAELEPTYNL